MHTTTSQIHHTDSYIWGEEDIIWGYEVTHQYTLKILRPKLGLAGALSLQYHNEKSESWYVLKGTAWMLLIDNGEIITRTMHKGDIQTLPAGVIHRLMALSSDLEVLEASTPDRHAADKSYHKDVVRLACAHGRPVSAPRTPEEARLVAAAIEVTAAAGHRLL